MESAMQVANMCESFGWPHALALVGCVFGFVALMWVLTH